MGKYIILLYICKKMHSVIFLNAASFLLLVPALLLLPHTTAQTFFVIHHERGPVRVLLFSLGGCITYLFVACVSRRVLTMNVRCC